MKTIIPLAFGGLGITVSLSAHGPAAPLLANSLEKRQCRPPKLCSSQVVPDCAERR